VLAAKFIEVVNDYLEQSVENLQSNGGDYLKYLVTKGLRTVMYVFTFILLYTNNDELALHHAQKASYLYIEFMGQIGQADHTYLGLSARDASLFVYKKTIFEIDSHVRRDWTQGDKKTRSRIEAVGLMTKLYVIISERLIRQDAEGTLRDRIKLLSKRSSNSKLIEMVVEIKHGVTPEVHLARLKLLTRAVEFYCETSLSNADMLASLKNLYKKIVRGTIPVRRGTEPAVRTDLGIKELLEKGDIVAALQLLR
jgi:hypothetical protein